MGIGHWTYLAELTVLLFRTSARTENRFAYLLPCVSTMLTESGLSIALPVRHFKALCDEKQGASRHHLLGAPGRGTRIPATTVFTH